MSKISAGLLLYRKKENKLEFLLVHPGGPFFSKKDWGNWGIPKGEVGEGEDLFDCAKREFFEEVGFMPEGSFTPIGSVKMKSGKTVHAWAVEGDFDLKNFKSATFKLMWPSLSGIMREFPEVDKAEFFDLETAKRKIHPSQAEFLDRIALMVNSVN